LNPQGNLWLPETTSSKVPNLWASLHGAEDLHRPSLFITEEKRLPWIRPLALRSWQSHLFLLDQLTAFLFLFFFFFFFSFFLWMGGRIGTVFFFSLDFPNPQVSIPRHQSPHKTLRAIATAHQKVPRCNRVLFSVLFFPGFQVVPLSTDGKGRPPPLPLRPAHFFFFGSC